MEMTRKAADSDLHGKLKWLIAGRFLFGILLLGSTITLQLAKSAFPTPEPFRILYLLIFAILLFSVIYTLIFRFHKAGKKPWHAYGQIILDSIAVTGIIHITGGFSSIFSFLYLLIVIIASILLFKKGSLFTAGLCSFEYGAILYAEGKGMVDRILFDDMIPLNAVSPEEMFYKVLITGCACLAVAFLSGVLSEQARTSKIELLEMEKHVKRVEKMAYMGQMAANLAHEIKNPLASLAGSIQLLREEIPYNPSQDKLIQIILRETDRLSALANNFLFLSRLPAAKKERVMLERAIHDIVMVFKKDITPNPDVEIKTDLTADLRTRIDLLHLNQILLNLLLNAAEAIEDEGQIQIRTIPFKNDQILIEVSDTGRGISDDTINLIFDPFYTTKPNGTGLGLPIIHNILETYESRLIVDSKLNVGTTFRFHLKRD